MLGSSPRRSATIPAARSLNSGEYLLAMFLILPKTGRNKTQYASFDALGVEVPRSASSLRIRDREHPELPSPAPTQQAAAPQKTAPDKQQRHPSGGKTKGRSFCIEMSVLVERATGIEPASAAWEAAILPMNYAREGGTILSIRRRGRQSAPARAMRASRPRTPINPRPHHLVE